MQKLITKNYLYDNSWKEEIDEFAECIVNNQPVENGTSEDALKVMEMIFDGSVPPRDASAVHQP